jgi:fatty-acyl-CoA synthase
VPRYVRFVTEWPMSGTKMKKVILREMIAADLKERGSPEPPRSPSRHRGSHSLMF